VNVHLVVDCAHLALHFPEASLLVPVEGRNRVSARHALWLCSAQCLAVVQGATTPGASAVLAQKQPSESSQWGRSSHLTLDLAFGITEGAIKSGWHFHLRFLGWRLLGGFSSTHI